MNTEQRTRFPQYIALDDQAPYAPEYALLAMGHATHGTEHTQLGVELATNVLALVVAFGTLHVACVNPPSEELREAITQGFKSTHWANHTVEFYSLWSEGRQYLPSGELADIMDCVYQDFLKVFSVGDGRQWIWGWRGSREQEA